MFQIFYLSLSQLEIIIKEDLIEQFKGTVNKRRIFPLINVSKKQINFACIPESF